MGPAPSGADAPPRRRPESPRIQIARAAADAARGHRGVVALDGRDGSHATHTAGDTIPGVVVVADGPGTYGVSLYLHADLVNLPELAASVRHAVRGALDHVGLSQSLGEVAVTVTDVGDDRDQPR